MRERGLEAEARWRVLVSEQEESGKSVAAFCRERGVPASQMFSWKKRFREAAAAKFVEVAMKPALPATSAVAVRGGGIEVRLRGRRSLVVELGFDAGHLRALLAVLDTSPDGEA
jgi:transposase-like protein